jgi:hypothetical protein
MRIHEHTRTQSTRRRMPRPSFSRGHRTAAHRRLAHERRRLRAHFRAVLDELRGRDVAHLSPTQREARARLIDELARYARTGRFPRNLDHPGILVPYFVDAFGTRCAVAHLVESTGDTGLVARIAATANNAFVRDLEGDMTLRVWLDRHGLTAAEAARIQPSYCFITNADQCYCGQVVEQAGAVIEGMALGPATMGKLPFRVDAVHGDMSLASAGEEIELDLQTQDNAKLLIGLPKNPSGNLSVFQLTNNGNVITHCVNVDLPAPSKQNIIEALLASNCVESLAKVDEEWGESVCDDGCGCSHVAPSGFSPWVLGPLLVAAAITARRRTRARRRRMHHDF